MKIPQEALRQSISSPALVLKLAVGLKMMFAVGAKLAPRSVEIQSWAASLQVVGRVDPVGAAHC